MHHDQQSVTYQIEARRIVVVTSPLLRADKVAYYLYTKRLEYTYEESIGPCTVPWPGLSWITLYFRSATSLYRSRLWIEIKISLQGRGIEVLTFISDIITHSICKIFPEPCQNSICLFVKPRLIGCPLSPYAQIFIECVFELSNHCCWRYTVLQFAEWTRRALADKWVTSVP